MSLFIFYDDVVVVYVCLQGVVYKMFVLMLVIVNVMIGVELFFKVESFQCMGVFKFCGVYNVLL